MACGHRGALPVPLAPLASPPLPMSTPQVAATSEKGRKTLLNRLLHLHPQICPQRRPGSPPSTVVRDPGPGHGGGTATPVRDQGHVRVWEKGRREGTAVSRGSQGSVRGRRRAARPLHPSGRARAGQVRRSRLCLSLLPQPPGRPALRVPAAWRSPRCCCWTSRTSTRR